MNDELDKLRHAIAGLTKERDLLLADLLAERDGKNVGEIAVVTMARNTHPPINGTDVSMRVVINPDVIRRDGGNTLLRMLAALGIAVANHCGVDLREKVLKL